MEAKSQEAKAALAAKEQELQLAKQQAQYIQQTATQNINAANERASNAAYQINQNMTAANDRACSAERERMKIEADLKSQHDTDARQIEHLRNQAQLAEVQLKAQQEFLNRTNTYSYKMHKEKLKYMRKHYQIMSYDQKK